LCLLQIKEKEMKKILLLSALAFLAACGVGTGVDSPSESLRPGDFTRPFEEGYKVDENEYVLITHFSGQTFVPVNPQRIVIFDLATFDSLDYLGLGDRIIGAPTEQLTPILGHYSHLPSLGTMHEPNLELVVAEDPDLIIIMGRARPMFDELTQIAPTLDFGINNMQFLEYVRRNGYYLGRLFGIESRIEEILSEIDELIEETKQLAENTDKKALIVMYNNGAISAFGPHSRFGGLIHDDLGVPYVDEGIEIVGHGMIISNEYIVEKNPDIIFVIDRGATEGYGAGSLMNRADFENELVQLTNAYQNGNIFYLDSITWYVSPGGLQGVRSQITEIRDALLNAQ